MSPEREADARPGGELRYLNVFDPEFDPAGEVALEALAADGWARTDLGLAALRYDWIRELLADRRFRHGTAELLGLQGDVDGPLADWWRIIMLTNEGDRHKRLRSLVSRAFGPSVAESLRPVSRDIVRALIGEFGDAAVVEAAGSLADQFPIRVLTAMLGVPEECLAEVESRSNELAYAFSLEVAARRESLEEAVVALLELADELVADRRSAPGDDLVSRFIAAETADERFTEDELRALVVSIIFAGHDTTRCQLLRALELFTKHPDQWERLASDPRLAQTAVEEVLRVLPSVPVVMRLATEPVDAHGQHFDLGDVLLLSLATAHHDPAAFGDELGFDVAAQRVPHLAFGGGIHYCIGAALARVELEEALLELTQRFHAPIVAGDVKQRGAFGIVGPTSLPLQLRRRG